MLNSKTPFQINISFVKSEYTMKNTKSFINEMKNVKFPKDHIFASFDLKSMFTNLSLDETINFALKRIYIEREV